MSGDSLLDVQNLYVMSSAGKTLVNDVSLSVARGERVGILGASGSGKSTTMRALFDLLPQGLRRSSGHIELNGKDMTAAPPAEWERARGRGIGLIPQDPKGSLVPVVRIGSQMVALYRAHYPVSQEEARAAAHVALLSVKLADPPSLMRKYPHELSGGMAQRVTIAMALMVAPPLIVADEPTTGLDVILQAEVLNLLKALTSERDTGMLIISHDLGVISTYTDRVYVMNQSRVIESGRTTSVLEAPSDPYTQELVAASALEEIDGQ